jgi:phosphopantetheinyl transferase
MNKLFLCNYNFHVLAQVQLNQAELEHQKQLVKPELRDKYFIRHAALHHFLNVQLKCPPDIIFNSFGKPVLRNSELHFNISHSRDSFAIFLNDSKCGIDIEYMEQHDDLLSLAQGFMHDDELSELIQIQDKLSAFYSSWTAKEATLKALGCGLTLDPCSLNIGFSTNALSSRSIILMEKSYSLHQRIIGNLMIQTAIEQINSPAPEITHHPTAKSHGV